MVPKDPSKEVKKVEPKKFVIIEIKSIVLFELFGYILFQITESESVKTIETLQQDVISTVHKHRHHSTSSSSSEEIKKKDKSKKLKKSSKVSSDEEKTVSKKSYNIKELVDTNKKKNRVEKLPKFNYVYCDSCIHWCQPCNIFPKTAKEYLTHLHSESHKTTLEVGYI